MRQQFQCLTCKGVYFDVSTEGGTYHHVCPPLPRQATAKELRDYNPRNENITPAAPGRPVEIVAEGRGVQCLSRKELDEPAWITVLKDKQAAADAKR